LGLGLGLGLGLEVKTRVRVRIFNPMMKEDEKLSDDLKRQDQGQETRPRYLHLNLTFTLDQTQTLAQNPTLALA
jgi:hypothetical protein